jgi:hypothetical protein
MCAVEDRDFEAKASALEAKVEAKATKLSLTMA